MLEELLLCKILQLHTIGEDIFKHLDGLFNNRFYLKTNVLEFEPTAQQHALASIEE